jgi:CheY-like chemotaxis protein
MSKKRVLIMDEEYWSIEPVIDRMQSLFGKETTVYCSDGTEGIERLKSEEFCCIILDIMFPLGASVETDEDSSQSIRGGLIILKRIREVLKCKTPVICFTIRDDDEVKNEISKYANAMHISKLNIRSMELLMTQLRKYLN